MGDKELVNLHRKTVIGFIDQKFKDLKQDTRAFQKQLLSA
jgi:hypothetical protein